MSNKKNKTVTSTTTPTAMPAPGVVGVTPKVKKTKVKVEIPLTPAQVTAKEAMDKANAEAQAELRANSAGKIAEADKKIADIIVKLTAAKAERKALNKALGIKGVFGGRKATKLTYVQDYPEGKGAPQARGILEIVKAAGKDGIAREDVVKTMEKAIKTNMDRSRLLSYYTSRMVADGVISAA